MCADPAIALRETLSLRSPSSKALSAEEFVGSFDLARVPTGPGCYLMYDPDDRVIYVGKAKNLRIRIRTYINEQDSRYSVKFLMRRVVGMEFLVTRTEKEAVLLENSLIKEHKPRYNVQLKDDKTHISLRFSPKEDFPRITVVRRFRKDGAKYFGPYSSAQAVRETLRQIQRLFPLRTCTDSVMNNRTRPCLYYQMKQCTAPCVGHVDRESYHEIVDQVLMILDGRNAELEETLLKQMQVLSETLEFEKAATVRDRLLALRRTFERQRTVGAPGAKDRDVFGVYSQGRYTEIQVLFFRGGKMMGGRSFSFRQREMPVDEVLGSFLLQYYSETPTIPAETLLPVRLEEAGVLSEILSEQRGVAVTVHWPQRGEKAALVDLANRNARSSFDEKQLAQRANRDLLEDVRSALKLSRTPQRIECFDISTTQGANAVGSMVVFERGAPDKSRYRRFSIKQVEHQDDFAMMREVLLRRYKRAIEEGDLPDLVLVDGGKGQLGVASSVFKDLGIEDLEAAAIAKSRSMGGGNRLPERFFRPGRVNPIFLRQSSPVVLFLARIRDEAHRFAVAYHRRRRRQAGLRTPLLDIPGIGPKRAKTLLNKVGSFAKITQVPVEELAGLTGFNETLARSVKEYVAASLRPAPSGGTPSQGASPKGKT